MVHRSRKSTSHGRGELSVQLLKRPLSSVWLELTSGRTSPLAGTSTASSTTSVRLRPFTVKVSAEILRARGVSSGSHRKPASLVHLVGVGAL